MSRQDDIDYDRQADQIRAENAVLLDEFEAWLEESGLKEKTVRKHMGNVSFYIDDYLLYDEIVRPQEGLSAVNGFFEWFFPRKAMWSSVTSTKETVASLKKFYRYLSEIGLVEASEYHEFLAEVKSEMPGWLGHYCDFEAW
jgi:hypothetical protein